MSSEALRAEWISELEALRKSARTAGARPGIAGAAQLGGKSGLQIMQAMLAGELPYPHIMDTLDYGLVQVEKGRAVFQGTPQLAHYNPLGSVHGGWYATLLDSALGCAVHTMLAAGQGYTTAELGIHIVRAASQEAARCARPAPSCTAAGRWPRPKRASSTPRAGSTRTARRPAWCSPPAVDATFGGRPNKAHR